MARTPTLAQAKSHLRQAAGQIDLVDQLRKLTPRMLLEAAESGLILAATMSVTGLRKVLLAGLGAMTQGNKR